MGVSSGRPLGNVRYCRDGNAQVSPPVTSRGFLLGVGILDLNWLLGSRPISLLVTQQGVTCIEENVGHNLDTR